MQPIGKLYYLALTLQNDKICLSTAILTLITVNDSIILYYIWHKGPEHAKISTLESNYVPSEWLLGQ